MLKRYFIFAAVICLGMTAAAFEVRQIVIPENPTAVEKYAAEVLAKYLGKVFNRRFPIAKSSVLPSKGSCCVGPFFAAEGLKNFPELADEESLGKSVDGRLFATLNEGDECIIKKSDKVLKMVTFNQNNTFATLFKKMKILEDVK